MFVDSSKITASFIEHDQVVVHGNVICHGIPGTEAVRASGQAFIKDGADPPPDGSFVGPTKEVHVHPAENADPVTVPGRNFLLNRVIPKQLGDKRPLCRRSLDDPLTEGIYVRFDRTLEKRYHLWGLLVCM